MNSNFTKSYHLGLPADIILLVVFFYKRYELSLTELLQVFEKRGFFLKETEVLKWLEKYQSVFSIDMKQSKRIVRCFVVDSPIRLFNQTYHLYRAIDFNGNLVDCYLSPIQNVKKQVEYFYRQAFVDRANWPKRIDDPQSVLDIMRSTKQRGGLQTVKAFRAGRQGRHLSFKTHLYRLINCLSSSLREKGLVYEIGM